MESGRGFRKGSILFERAEVMCSLSRSHEALDVKKLSTFRRELLGVKQDLEVVLGHRGT